MQLTTFQPTLPPRDAAPPLSRRPRRWGRFAAIAAASAALLIYQAAFAWLLFAGIVLLLISLGIISIPLC